MILVIDNYDSFVETLARYARLLGHAVTVVRADTISVEQALALNPCGVILSPGPGRPGEVGIMLPLIGALPETPILGVCLGHQALAEAYGGHTSRAAAPVHGRSSKVFHDGDPAFAGVPSPFEAGRYHALRAVLPEADDPELQPIAWLEDGTVMALRHRSHPHVGVQFHPESLLTPDGMKIVANVLGGGEAV